MVEAAYTLRDDTTAATFDCISDTTLMGTPTYIQTVRLNAGVDDTNVTGQTPDTRVLTILLLNQNKYIQMENLNTLYKSDTIKRLVAPDFENASSSATTGGEYIMRGMEKRVTQSHFEVRLTLLAKDSDVVT